MRGKKASAAGSTSDASKFSTRIVSNTTRSSVRMLCMNAPVVKVRVACEKEAEIYMHAPVQPPKRQHRYSGSSHEKSSITGVGHRNRLGTIPPNKKDWHR